MTTIDDTGSYYIMPDKCRSDNKSRAIIYSVDDNTNCNYQCINSIFQLLNTNSNLIKPSDIYILTITTNTFISVYQKKKINVIILDQFINKFFEPLKLHNTNNIRFQPISTYYRLFIFKIPIFRSYDQLIYFDCDTVVHRNLDDFFKFTVNRCYAVEERPINRNPVSDLLHFITDKQIPLDGLHLPTRYFNAGVLIFNTRLINFDFIFDSILRLLPHNFTWHDQDILNIVFSDFCPILPVYNSFKFTDSLYQNRTDIVIQHVCGYHGIQKNIQTLGKKIYNHWLYDHELKYIPKILHFIWISSDDIPSFVRNTLNAYAQMNPEFKINFIYEKSVDSLINSDAIECWKLINSSTSNIYQKIYNNKRNLINTDKYVKFTNIRFSDTFRFFLLEKYGGIYLDCDTFPVKSFDNNLLQYDFKICRSFIGKTPVSNDICVNDIFFIACIPKIIFKYYNGFDSSKPSNYFDSDVNDALFEYTDRNYDDYASLGHSTKHIRDLSRRYFNGEKLIPEIDRRHLLHDWNNMEHNYYIDHYNLKSWLK